MKLDETKSADLQLLSIDAWRDGDGGWTWNNWHKVGTVPRSLFALTQHDTAAERAKAQRAMVRRVLRYLRFHGYLGAHSVGRVTTEEDTCNFVILARGTREPLLAIELDEV